MFYVVRSKNFLSKRCTRLIIVSLFLLTIYNDDIELHIRKSTIITIQMECKVVLFYLV